MFASMDHLYSAEMAILKRNIILLREKKTEMGGGGGAPTYND